MATTWAVEMLTTFGTIEEIANMSSLWVVSNIALLAECSGFATFFYMVLVAELSVKCLPTNVAYDSYFRRIAVR